MTLAPASKKEPLWLWVILFSDPDLHWFHMKFQASENFVFNFSLMHTHETIGSAKLIQIHLGPSKEVLRYLSTCCWAGKPKPSSLQFPSFLHNPCCFAAICGETGIPPVFCCILYDTSCYPVRSFFQPFVLSFDHKFTWQKQLPQ